MTKRQKVPQRSGSWLQSACPSCGSSDAFSWKAGDSFGYCFSCGTSNPLDEDEDGPPIRAANKHSVTRNRMSISVEDIWNSLESGPIEDRKLRANIVEHFDVLLEKDEDGETIGHFYPYHNAAGDLVAYKHRSLPKDFTIVGDSKKVQQLFGQRLSTGGKRLIITEGELDCLSVAQAQYEHYQKHYPVVSIPSASQLGLLLKNREWLRRFEEIVLAFDQDEAGKEAAAKAAKIIGYDRTLIATYPEKDPSEVLMKRGGKALLHAIWDAKRYTPAGLVSGEDLWKAYTEIQQVTPIPYPACMEGINEKLRGMRKGEIVLLISGTGSGKSTMMKEILLELREQPMSEEVGMIGSLFLEESSGDTAEKLMSMYLQHDLSKEPVDEEIERAVFETLFLDERLIFLDHQGSVADETLLDRIEYMALAGCTHILLDHLTIAVSEGDGSGNKNSNEVVDAFMSQLLKIVKRHNVWVGLIAHLRKTPKTSGKPAEEGELPTLDDIKGSGSIKQICFDIIAFARDMTHEDPIVRNTIKVSVLKARKTGETGPAGYMRYSHSTMRMQYVDPDDFNSALTEEDM